MNQQPEPHNLQQAFQTTVMIHGAMMIGVVSVAVVLIAVLGLPVTPDVSKLTVEWVGIAVAAINTIVCLTVFQKPMKSVVGQGMDGPPEARYFAEWQITSLIRFALLEGAALVNVIFSVFHGGGWLNLAPALACLGVMMVLFPTRYGWESYLNERLGEP
ncbi:MAG: hypothetical protein FJ261_12040 [Planctomycetes bacterium]|nr:hypothetical protein [Planctomycetota bacterium]